MPRILVVEDEADIRQLMLMHLKRDGYELDAAEDGEKGLKLFEANKYDLAILDWMLPGLSGLDLCKEIQKKCGGEQCVLMVTARADAADIVLGLELGADDYITKPFEVPVFLARVRALLRRSASHGAFLGASKSQKRFEAGGLVVDIESHEVFCQGEPAKLTTSEFKLLVALLENQGRVLSRNKLIDLVQGEGVIVVDRAIDTHVFGLRKKLGPCADVVETIRGVGYRVKNL